MALLPPAPR